MNKKGFTLVEIIICIALLAVIGTTTFIGFKSAKNKEKTKEKIISDIISAADVYYSMNSDIKDKLANNYGYHVLSIDDLKKEGLLDNNKKVPELSAEENEEKKSYDKMVVDSNKLDEIGIVDYIYPYEKTQPFIANLDPISIEFEEKSEFKCNSGLKSIDYMDEDYNKTSSPDFECGIEQRDKDDNDNTDYKSNDASIEDLQEGKNTLSYRIKVKNKYATGDRIVTVNPKYNPDFVKTLENSRTEYTCGNYTNENVILSFSEDEYERELEFNWYKDNENITNDTTSNSLIVYENGMYEGKYILKGKLSPDLKIKFDNDYSCDVKIDKINPEIEITTTNKQVNVNISDETSGVYGYYYSKNKVDKTNLNKKMFTEGTKFSFTSPTKSTMYYILAMDNAGNITEKMYETVGEENYPSITWESIENSFTKFKVTIKNISNNKDYNINLKNIKIQYVYNEDAKYDNGKPRYRFYNKGYNPGKYNDGYLETFLENYAYNESYSSKSANYVEYKKGIGDYTCNENECSFVLDMEDAIKSCEKKYYCKRIVDYSDLYKLDLIYYIYAENKKGYFKEIQLNSILNIYEDENAFQDTWFNYEKWIANLIGTNSRGDILYTEYDSDRDSRKTTIYYYNNQDAYAINLGRYWNWDQIVYDWFDDYSLGFTTCNTYTRGSNQYKEYFRYEYILSTGEWITYDSYNKKNNSRCNFRTKVGKQYQGIAYNKMYENGSYLSEYLIRLRPWEKESVTNPTRHRISNLLNNYVFYRTINGVEWNSILTQDTSRNEGQSSSRSDYNRLYFLPEVTLKLKSSKTGS